MKEEVVRKINQLGRNPNNVPRLVRKMMVQNTDDVGGRCMQENDGTLHLNEEDRRCVPTLTALLRKILQPMHAQSNILLPQFFWQIACYVIHKSQSLDISFNLLER